MNEIEKAISEIIGTNYGECQCHRETMVQAVEALREKQARESGCEWCADNYDHRHKTMFRKGSDWNYEAKYCPMCGKRLEEHHEADTLKEEK
jgi:hypothetical protein